MDIKIGSDPELFVFRNGYPVCAEGLCEGTKENPIPVNMGAVQVDGMALEYNTNPVSTVEEWHKVHETVQEEMKQFLLRGMSLRAVPTAYFSNRVFKNASEEAKELGCMPDFNAYTGMMNEPPNPDVDFRTGAGHVHIGWTEGADADGLIHMNDCKQIVKLLDVYLGLPSVLVDHDKKRRELYGDVGAFRPKPYGVEYRVLSNFWVTDRALRGWVFNNTMLAMEQAMTQGEVYQNLDNIDPEISFDEHPKWIRKNLERWEIPLPPGV